MCTAISFFSRKHYFGRNLDLEGSFGESVAIVPRNFPWEYRFTDAPATKCAIIGVATEIGGIPLFYDAVNEHGLGIAALNFPKNAVYREKNPDKCNLASFELIPYLLTACKTVAEAKEVLKGIELVAEPFGKGLPVTPLHWMVSDREASIVVEPTAGGLMVYDNPVGVLTNNPPFPIQLAKLDDYLYLTPYEPVSRFSEHLKLAPYSRGMGALGLPGDSSSTSRFVRAVFARENIVAGEEEENAVSAFFRMLDNVAMLRGCVRLKEGVYEETVYSSCANCDDGVYYVTTNTDRSVSAYDLHRENLDADAAKFYPIGGKLRIARKN